MSDRLRRLVLPLVLAVWGWTAASAQDVPDAVPAVATYEILSVSIAGIEDESARAFARSVSGLRAGQRVTLPYDPAFGEAVRNLYTRAQFSNVEIVADEIVDDGVFVRIDVTEEPKLGGYEIEGLKRSERDDLADRIPLLRGRAVRPGDVQSGRLAIVEFLREKGFRSAEVESQQTVGEDGRVLLTYTVDRGERSQVAEIRFSGNEAFSDARLRKTLKNTPEKRWWRFWKRETFDREGFDEDLQAVQQFYQDRGHYGAYVAGDSVYVDPADPGRLIVEVEVVEGPQYAIRDILFEGNTVYSDAQLRQALGIQTGDTYNGSLLERNLYYAPDHSDVSSLYSDRGYLRFNVLQRVDLAPGDSLDLSFEITEGEVYEFGGVQIAGNTRTKEHVIRREIRTIPGQPYSRQAIERTVRELAQLNYFDPTSFGNGPSIDVDDQDQSVDLTYTLAETSSDQLELSGGWGGSVGLLLTARVTFNNFSLQNLVRGEGGIPSGDGQQLSLQVVTSGKRYQNYSLSFTEPWFQGRQTPVGFSLGYSDFRSTSGATRVSRGYGRVFYRQRLKWPDDFFSTGSNLGYQLYNISGSSTGFGLPEGISQEVTFSQSLTRNAVDNPLFPSAGSNVGLTVSVAPPIPGFIQYHKWQLSNAWYTPVAGRLSASVKADFGYIGSLTGEEVEFQRFLVGGSPLETSGGSSRGFGKDLVFMRGYPLEAIGPRRSGDAVGGRILNKYSAELQLVALQTPSLSAAPYIFLDAANTYDSFDSFDPSFLYRSAGFGAKLFLPILGPVDLNYGYQIDPFDPIDGEDDGSPQWRFQLSLGGQ